MIHMLINTTLQRYKIVQIYDFNKETNIEIKLSTHHDIAVKNWKNQNSKKQIGSVMPL